MSRKWRVAVLGLGHWYSAYGLARALPEYPRAELVAAAWHDPEQLDEFTTAFGVPGYATANELLSRERVDIVHIAAPVAQIPALAIQAAHAGKHIVLGKPMAMTVERGRPDGRGGHRERRAVHALPGHHAAPDGGRPRAHRWTARSATSR